MKVKLSEIKTKSPRVRQSQDPEKLDELAASITAFGQAIIPVGVRKNGQGYDLVYGHRRVAAAKQAGLTEIDAVEVTAGDDMLKVFGLTENVVREGMAPSDIANALQQIKDESGWTNSRLGRFFGHTDAWVESYLKMLEADVVKILAGKDSGFTPEHLAQVRAGLGAENRAQTPAVIKKVIDEGLSKRQARHVADEVRGADGKKEVARILREPYERIAQATAPLPPSEVLPSQWSKPKTDNPLTMMNLVEAAIRTIDGLLVKLVSSRDRKALLKRVAPKWVAFFKRWTKMLEGMA